MRNIISTKELFRVEYFEGKNFKSLVRQQYSDGTSHYTVMIDGRSPIEGSSSDLGEIITWLERCLRLDKQAARRAKKYNARVQQVHAECLKNDKIFLDRVKRLHCFESTEVHSFTH